MAATNQPRSRADKFSTYLRQYPKDELKLFEGKSLIGAGGFGRVVKYRHKDKIVAVKEFTIGGDDEAIEKIWNMVLREANILCRFHHENVVKILGITQWQNVVGIIMEYVDGGNLQSLLSEDNHSKLSWNTRLEIARGITSGLDYIHNYGETKTFCHGDIKPENVLLTSLMQIKLADFGSAALHQATGASTTTIKSGSSKQFTLIYVAPEFLEDNTRERIPAMDMFSFGMVMYELVSRKAPYSDSSSPNLVPALIMAKIKPSSKLIDNAENQLESDDDRAAFNLLKGIMEKCWNNDPSLRPSSRTVEKELSSYLMDQKLELSSPKDGTETISAEAAENSGQIATRVTATPVGTLTSRQDVNLYDTKSSAPLPSSGQDQTSTSAGPSTLLDNNISDRDYLESYTDSLLNKDYEQADLFRAVLRSYIVDEFKAKAEDVRLLGEKLHREEKYLQSFAVFDTAAALFAELKNPEEDLERIQFCIQGMKLASEKMIDEDSNMKTIVIEHVLPLMRHWLEEMKATTKVSEKWKCHTVSWALSNIELCETCVGLWDKRKQTLKEAVSGMRSVFGPEAHTLHGRLFGTLLNNLGIAYKRESRFEKATALFQESVEAHKVAVDYFGDDVKRTKDIEISEKNLKSCLRQNWEKQLQMR